MKVLALVSSFGLCGQGLAAHYISHELACRKHKVHLRVFDPAHKLGGEFKDPAYEIDYRPSVSIMPATGLSVLRQGMDLLRLQKDKGFDVVLGLDGSEVSVLGGAFAKEAGLNFAFVSWGNELVGLSSAERGVLRNCELVLPVSRWAKANLIENNFDESLMKVLPPGVDLGLFSPPKTRPKGLGIVTVTKLTKGSGVDGLIDVLKILLDRGQDAFLSVVGSGPELKTLERMAKRAMLDGSVRFLGKVPHKKLPEVLRQHRVFALIPRPGPDVTTPDFSLAMMEASSCGLGVIGTDMGGIADSLRTCSGTKVLAEAAIKTADIIERVAGKLSIVMATEGEYGRARSWADVAGELETVLEDLVYE